MSALRYALHGQACAHLSISLTDSFQPTERQLSTRFGAGVPRRWRRLDSSSKESLGAAAAAKSTRSWVPSQNGFVLDWPQRQSAIVSPASNRLPSASRRVTLP